MSPGVLIKSDILFAQIRYTIVVTRGKIDYFTIIEYGAKKAAQEAGVPGDGWLWDDATWVLCASFIIFTMQTGKNKVL